MTQSLTGIKVKLIGRDGNAFAIIGECVKQMRRNGISNERIEEFREEAMSGDYDNLLQTCLKWFDVD